MITFVASAGNATPDGIGFSFDYGHAAPQTTVRPSGHTVGVPAAQASNVHPGVPARPRGQSSTQLEPAAQLAEQLWSMHENRQVLAGPHVQLPFEHSPSHRTLSPAHCT
jgi:hypothetical protein